MSAQLQLVNASVASFGKTLFPWTIVRVSEVEHSVADFFYEDIKPRISDCAPKCELLSAQVGQEKNSLDNVDFSVPIIAVISSFGRYLKYSVTILQTASSSEAATTSLSSSALSQSADCVLISTVIQPADQKTMKDKLFNDILRIIFSKYKLKKEQCVYLQALLDNYMYSCGASLKDLELPEEYSTVEIRDHDCYDPIEKLYYSAKNDPICMYCVKDQPYTSEEYYPLCSDCESRGKVAVLKRK